MLRMFCAYAREDDEQRRLLDTFLQPLTRRKLIRPWYDREICAGQDWDSEIAAQLDQADVILLLVSPYFIASEYVMGVEVERAMERHRDGSARVIPVLLSRADMVETPFERLQALPSTGVPVMEWGRGDRRLDAFRDIAAGVERSIDDFLGIAEYPDQARVAFRRCYADLDKSDREAHLGRPVPLNPATAESFTSRRGTEGFAWSFEQGGRIYWSAKGGAHPVWGAIGALFHHHPGARDQLGYPLTGERDAHRTPAGTQGRYQRFEGRSDRYDHDGVTFGASAYWIAGSDAAYPTWGAIGERYERTGGTSGALGFPTSHEERRKSPQGTTGLRQEFEHGAIYYCDKVSRGIPVISPVLETYRRLGGSTGRFGFPTASASTTSAGVHIQEFEGGAVCVDTTQSSAAHVSPRPE